MTPRRYAVVWGAAIFCTVLAFAALSTGTFNRYPDNDCARVAQPNSAKVFVIGSSLTNVAFGQPDAGFDLLADGRTGVVWPKNNISANHSLFLVRCAIAYGAETILLEANAFAFDRNVQQQKIQGQASITNLRTGTLSYLARAKHHLHHWFRSSVYPEPFLNTLQRSFEGTFDGTAPANKRVPTAATAGPELSKLAIVQARSETGIFFFEPPRTHMQRDDIEAILQVPLEKHLSEVAQQAGLQILKFWPSWPDGHFMDYQSHLNEGGKAAFRDELRAAWVKVRDAR